MLLFEKRIRKFIQESILLEAKFQLKNLLIFKETKIDESNLFDEINNKFIQIGGKQHDLNNPKSAGRFFIDVLFECMEEINEIIDDGKQNQIDIPDRILTICNYILFLFTQKETTSKSVQSGQTFKDYILNFMTYYNKTSYPGTTNIYEKLQYVFQKLNEKAIVSSIDSLLKEKNYIKSEKETLYPFGKDTIIDGYKVVCPLSIRSSIFWARTNWLGEDIVLRAQEDISWCTARFKGGNMFNSYFIGGGTNLFYFLPEDDLKGTNKFCIGITKIKKIKKDSELSKEDKKKKDELDAEDYKVWEYEQWKSNPNDWEYTLNVGGHTTVDFHNSPILDGQNNDFTSKEIKNKIKNALQISNENILIQLEKEMSEREPVDNEKYVSLLDVEQFAAATNIDNLAPINPITGKRDTASLEQISQSVENVINTYASKIYKVKGLVPDTKIVNYIDKNYLYWQKEDMNLNFYIPSKDRNNKEAIINNIKNYIIKAIEKNSNDSYTQAKPIIYEKILKQISPSLQNDHQIFMLCFFGVVMKYNDYKTSKTFKDFNFDKFPEKVDDIIQLFEEIFEYIKIEFQDFFDYKMQITFSSYFFKYISGIKENENLEEKFKKLDDEKLINMFFKFKAEIFLSAVSYEYYLNNPEILLKIAEFSNKNSLPSFLVSQSFNNADSLFGKDYFIPKELLSNKDFVLKLVKLDVIYMKLLYAFQHKLFKDEEIILNSLNSIRDIRDLNFIIYEIFNDKLKRKEIITYDFFKNLCDKNILCFYNIMLWSTKEESEYEWISKSKKELAKIKNSREQVQNDSNFVFDFISNEENIYKLIFSYKDENGISPAQGLSEFILDLNNLIENNFVNNYNKLKSFHTKISSNFSIFKKVIDFEKNKYNYNINHIDYIVSTRDLTSCCNMSIYKKVEEYIESNSNIINENKKLILTENQLRKLINHFL